MNEAAEPQADSQTDMVGSHLEAAPRLHFFARLPPEIRLLVWETYYANLLLELLYDERWTWRWNALNHIGSLAFFRNGTGEVIALFTPYAPLLTHKNRL